ncbi:head completion/stabilization protein [Novosphingopyxis sp. YJ-S2-01]|uniref:head completion/stabilization protein n=1 Tax=Novosphingopyxis sp. YJ-S2-01 TaxID=2794021 RepID=UPI0018DC6148|nr:head completion/stabilization protein [Novosphingopyxis sp. YJ-S2-01]MBH9536936.1 head completion/stabilization protein [Novosphingopyxis sp. YJ-S2-01]
MAGFVSSPATDPGNDFVAGDGFWPDLSIAAARDALRLDGHVSEVRLRDALRAGIIAARKDLRSWSLAFRAIGIATLADVDAEKVDGEPITVLLYRRAVLSFAAADLAETHHDISATADGKDRAEDRVLSADEHRRNATHAIRDLLGVTRTAVELI